MTPSGATFSDCGRYRYRLWRTIDGFSQPRGMLVFLMLNPSTADAEKNDPTVERCERRAWMMGFARLEVLNLFALRSTDPTALYAAEDPVGPDNDAAILEVCQRADHIICGWGVHGALRHRGDAVLRTLRAHGLKPCALRLNADGSPAHPLYIPYSQTPVPMP